MNWLIILYILPSILIGTLVMRKLDDTKKFNFIYLIVFLVLLQLFIVLSTLLGTKDALLFVALPFAVSFITGHIYFLIKGTY